MKLNQEQLESRLTASWGKKAHLVAYQMYGNRLTYAVTDHGDHWMPLERSWAGGRPVFQPVGMPWPSQDSGSWVEAVTKAAALARDHFVQQRNMAAVKRLPRAQVIAEARSWERQGDDADTWLIASTSSGGSVYRVNDRCTCPDFLRNGVSGGWCKHRLARALGRRAQRFLQEEKGARVLQSLPAPSSMMTTTKSDADSTSGSALCQARRIDLVLGYEADEAKPLALINANGKLIEFTADGEMTRPPVQDVAELYRWLLTNDFKPFAFRWLGWERGLRQRRQTYIRI
jgi:hypothetical protein